MTIMFEETSTTVPIAGEQSVELQPQQPWPSAYRGSRYSLVSDDDFDDAVLKWEHRDLTVFADPPAGLQSATKRLGKTNGYGSFRVTANGEVITKVKASDYPHLDQAPTDDGWIPAYLGQLSGALDFGDVDLDPDPPDTEAAVWTGLPFKHGERWAVSVDNTLIWKWRDYRFESAFDHPELINAYSQYRSNPGRLYITEHGHVWGNVPYNDVLPAKQEEVRKVVAFWKSNAESRGDTSTLRLVNRRLVATSQSDDPADGHLPLHLGHLSDFDSGTVPRPVVDNESYYLAVSDYEHVWE